jgi:hypothetical protein
MANTPLGLVLLEDIPTASDVSMQPPAAAAPAKPSSKAAMEELLKGVLDNQARIGAVLLEMSERQD